ncbi:MAG TPA: outer membrane beta-barrel protein [Gemmatimonadales bacterium]|nr:outer membrane beta-barrel protein [Gemmatimonadales bacterium]
MGAVRTIALGLVVSLAAAATASAQSPFTFGLGGGLTLPANGAAADLGLGSASFGSGWQGMGLLQVHPFGRLGFQLDGTYRPFGSAGVPVGGELFNGTANILYEFGRTRTSKVIPYVIGGAGVYSFRSRGPDDTSTLFGLNGGAGINLRLFGPGSLFLESRFHNVFGAGLSGDGSAHLIPITAGFKFSGP